MHRLAFFGSDSFSIGVLDALENVGISVDCIIAPPDRPAGRKLVLTSPEIVAWARERDIDLFQPEKLDSDAIATLTECEPFDAFIVASYGKIIPQDVLDIPRVGCLNVHPSPLPKHRGASPLEATILADERATGVSIIEMDEKMDHGPLAGFREIHVAEWPPRQQFEHQCATVGGELLADIIPAYIAGTHTCTPQHHELATFTKKISKTDAELSFDEVLAGGRSVFLKIQAYAGWPCAWFTIPSPSDTTRTLRVIIKSAHFEGTQDNGVTRIDRVVPEGSHEMDWDAFVRGYIRS